jgi:predicted TIM-barrel fold metal-dependent hydrolase
MMKTEAKNRIEQQLNFLKANKDNLVIDADTHLTDVQNLAPMFRKKLESTPDYFQGRPIDADDLLREMKMADVDMSLVWQNPAATLYPGNQEENFENILAANRYIFESAVKYPEKFIPAGWTDPKALGLDNAVKLADICVNEFGFAIVKMNPAQNQFPIDSPQVTDMVTAIVKLGAIPAFHYGADTPYTPASGLENLASRFPGSPIIAIHMGGGGAGYIEAESLYHESRQLGLKYPNIKFVLSAKRDTHIESDLITYQMAGEPFKNSLFCASDAPYGRQTWNFGGYRLMFESLMNGASHTDERLRNNPGLFNDNDVKGYLGGNFAGLITEKYIKLLNK